MGHHAQSVNAQIQLYHVTDKISGHVASEEDCQKLWRLSFIITHDSLGKLPLFPGMKPMVQENLTFMNKVVNGAEGTVQDIVYKEEGRRKYTTVAYIHILGSGNICTNTLEDIIPIFSEWTYFSWMHVVSGKVCWVNVSRPQLLILLVYAYIDYKLQGRSLDVAIVDLMSAGTLQGVYIILSRVWALNGVSILRPLKASKIKQWLSQKL